MAQITYEDKESVRDSNLPRKNSVTAEDLNEIKEVVNQNASETVDVAHEQNTDVALAENTANEVTAAEIRAFLDEPVNIYNGDGQLSSNRTINQQTNKLRVLNGKVVFGDVSADVDANSHFYIETSETIGLKSSAQTIGLDGVANSGIAVRGTTGSGIGGQFEGTSYGVAGYAYSGSAFYGESTNLAANLKGRVMIQTYGLTNTIDQSAMFQVDSTTSGALLPRVTTAQKNAIVLPANGLIVYDTNLNDYQVFNGSYWKSMSPTLISLTSGAANLTAGSNYYFGNIAIFPTTTEANRKFLAPVTKTIRKAFIRLFASTIAGDRSISIYVRINSSTDYLIATVNTSVANREFVNQSLNIPIVENVDTISCYAVASGGTTNSTGVYLGGYFICE